MKRGDIFVAELSPRSGSEQSGRRPVIVVSHNSFNQTAAWRSIVVVPLSTSVTQAGRGPTVALLRKGVAGLGRDSVALGHQVTTIDRSNLTKQVGTLSQATMGEVDQALKNALALE